MTLSLFSETEKSVRQRYSAAAQARESALCCPVKYDAKLLEVIPEEILEKDYGCGDPTPYVRPGESVLDLGCGGGKVCYIAAQLVGPQGKVIGVDCNNEMMALAKKYQGTMAEKLGYANVEFRYGLIQDLKLDLERLESEISKKPIRSTQDWLELRSLEESLRRRTPLIADETIDCVLSNCVLNLVRPRDRQQLFREIYRVLRPGGRVAICDIVSDEEVPPAMQADPDLWSGCIAGAFREDRFLQAFEKTGFHGIQMVSRESKPWQVVNGIEFRSVTVLAYKGKDGPCLERKQALIYKGPFKSVEDDDGHRFPRGERMAVCDKTFHLLQREPYKDQFEPIEPYQDIPLDQAKPFDCKRTTSRHPRETKGENYHLTTEAEGNCCEPGGGCC